MISRKCVAFQITNLLEPLMTATCDVTQMLLRYQDPHVTCVVDTSLSFKSGKGIASI